MIEPNRVAFRPGLCFGFPSPENGPIASGFFPYSRHFAHLFYNLEEKSFNDAPLVLTCTTVLCSSRTDSSYYVYNLISSIRRDLGHIRSTRTTILQFLSQFSLS